MSTIYRKVLADLWSNKTRTLLTVLTITVGVFAVGTVSNLHAMAYPDMDGDYQSTNPHGAIIYCAPFDDDLLPTARQVPGVGDVEGRSELMARAVVDQEEKVTVQIIAIPPVGSMRVDRIRPAVAGERLTLADREVFVERTAAQGAFPFDPGDTVTIELPDGTVRELRLAAFVHDPTKISQAFTNMVTLYVTQDTMVWLGGSWDYNQMLVTITENRTDQAHVSAVAQAVADKIERSGREVHQAFVYMPGQHFADDIFQAVAIILGTLGTLAVFLSAFLVVNTVMALLGQHIRQIGIMKAVGGRTSQIVSMYIGQVFLFGVLAFLIAIPLSACVAYQVDVGLGEYLNYRPGPFRIPSGPVLLQAVIALVSPVAAALAPVLNGARITVREATSNYGLAQGHLSRNLIDRLLERIRFLSRPLLLSLRNAFRRKARLTLTLSTLTLGGAIFIAVFNLWAGFDAALDDTMDFLLADVNVSLARPYRLQRLGPLVTDVPGVVGMEGWGASSGQLLSDDGETAVEIALMAPPSDSTQVRPVMVAGRWLLPEDENAVVIGNHLLKERPDLNVGDEVVIKTKDKEYTWQVVGIYKLAGNIAPPIVFANYERLSWLRNETGMVSDLRIVTFPQDAATQARVGKMVEARFEQTGIPVVQVQTKGEFSAQQAAAIDVLIYFLLVMATLIAVVGGLGLMGTMSMNVLERTREIGVMRAVGASSGAILRIVIAEGMLVGIISWILAALLSLPITLVLVQGVGTAILTVPVDFVLDWQGPVFWLAGILALGALTSALPAWSAARLTIRQVLAYE